MLVYYLDSKTVEAQVQQTALRDQHKNFSKGMATFADKHADTSKKQNPSQKLSVSENNDRPEIHHSIPAFFKDVDKKSIPGKSEKDNKNQESKNQSQTMFGEKNQQEKPIIVVQSDNKKEERPDNPESKFTAAGLANFISIILNTVSAISNCAEVFDKGGKENRFVKMATRGGELGTKIFYTVNSLQNIYNRLHVNDFLGMLGYLFDLPIAYFSKQQDIFLWRGFSTGAYTFANGAKEALKKEEFANIFDHIKSMGLALSKMLSYAENGFSGFWQNLIASKTGLQSMIAGMILFVSPIFWRLSGLKFIGTCIRDLGGITQDLAQIKPGYMLSESEKTLPFFEKIKLAVLRAFGMKSIPSNAWPIYFRSGLNVTAGTICDWVRGFLEKTGASQNLINIATALTYITDGTGIYLLGRSQDREIGRQKVKTVSMPTQPSMQPVP